MGAGAELDDAAFERWVRAFRGPLSGLLASWGASWSLADELAQDAFAEAWVGRARFRGAAGDLDAAGSWLRGIAWNLWRARARREAPRHAEPLTDEPADGAACSEPGDPDGSDERRERLLAAFARLSAPHRSVLRMTYLDETSPREVAALLGMTPKAVEGRLYRARRALRELVEREPRRGVEGARP